MWEIFFYLNLQSKHFMKCPLFSHWKIINNYLYLVFPFHSNDITFFTLQAENSLSCQSLLLQTPSPISEHPKTSISPLGAQISYLIFQVYCSRRAGLTFIWTEDFDLAGIVPLECSSSRAVGYKRCHELLALLSFTPHMLWHTDT